MYQKLDQKKPDDDAVRKMYQARNQLVEQKMREIWAMRGWTIDWDWHCGFCDDAEFLFDAEGKRLYPIENGIPHETSIATLLDKHKLNVTYMKKTVKIINKQADNPVTGSGDCIYMAYINWLLAFEKQKFEEKNKCAAN